MSERSAHETRIRAVRCGIIGPMRGLSLGAVAVTFVALGCGGGGAPVPDASAQDTSSGDVARDVAGHDATDAVADTVADSSDTSTIADGPREAGDGPPPDVAAEVGGDGPPSDGPGDAGDGGSPDAPPCAGEVLSADASAAFFPLRTGARWIFRAAGTINTVAVGPRLARRDVTGTKMFGTATAAVLVAREDDLNFNTVEEYLEIAATGVIDHGSSIAATQYGRAGRFAVPYTAIPFPITTCAPYQQFNVSTTGGLADADGDGIPENVTARATATFTLEDVTVPVGTFVRALRVEAVEDIGVTYTKTPGTTSHIPRRTTDWYAAGVGLVKHRVEPLSGVTTSELIAYAVGDARKGVVPTGYLAQDLTEAENNPYTPNRPAVGFDGTRYLVVVPTSSQTSVINDTGNLQAIVVDRDGNPVKSGPLLDASDELNAVAIALGRRALPGRLPQRLLRARRDADRVVHGRDDRGPHRARDRARRAVRARDVGRVPRLLRQDHARDGHAEEPRPHLDRDGRRVRAPDDARATLSRHAAVDGSLAKDDTGAVMALVYAPPATASTTSPEPANILAAARLTAAAARSTRRRSRWTPCRASVTARRS